MSDELRLPDHLAACEARLAALAPPAAGVNRDELLYQAGWAAAVEAARQATLPDLPAPRAGRRGTFAWSLASAAVAASVAVAVTLAWRPGPSSDLVERPPQGRADDAVAVVEALPAPPLLADTRIMRRLRSDNAISSGIIAQRQRALSDALSEPARLTLSAADAAASDPVTARQLMHELQPQESSRPLRAWSREQAPSGDSI